MSTDNNIEQVPGMLPMPPFTPAQRAAACVAACEGLPDHSLYGGWTAAGLSRYTKSLEDKLAAQTVRLLATEHQGMRVDYSGLLSRCRACLEAETPDYAEMLRQLQEHLQELGRRWYAGDTAVVDELLQLYCVEKDARAALIAAAPGTSAAEAG